MNLNELLEKAGDEVAIIFGRFNPPHVGHRDAWTEAAKSPIWYVGTNKTTVGLDDPLPYDVKVAAMKTIMPSIEGHVVAEQGWWTLATYVYEKHGPVTLYIVTDDKDAKTFVPGIQSQNGKEGKHGYYNFKNIEWRKADRISSATDLRAAVLNNDKESFAKAAGVDADTKVMGQSFFDLVAEYLLPYSDQIQARAERKAKKQAKSADESISEAPLEMDPTDPMDPMIYGHDKANPAKLKYRMLRAAGQLKDLASRAENASPSEWQIMSRQFEELKMNMEQIKHALEELGKIRKKGGIRSRGIDPMVDSVRESYGQYYCSTDKKWKTRKGPKQKRSS